MKRLYVITICLAITGALFAAPAWFTSPTETRWSVVSGGKALGTIVLTTNGKSVRAEWSGDSKTPKVLFIGADGKIWVRSGSGDLELADYRGAAEKNFVPALLLPFTVSGSDKLTFEKGKAATYAYNSGAATRATYQYDAKGVSSSTVTSGQKTYLLQRTSIAPGGASATLYEVRPRKGAATKIARLSGDLFGPTDRSVSATAGGRGVDKGPSFADGGDYDALSKLEARDETWEENLEAALNEFQAEGKVGAAAGGNR